MDDAKAYSAARATLPLPSATIPRRDPIERGVARWHDKQRT